jgi:hypothetical protein
MFFNGSSYYDGAPGVTQCAIPVGQSLTYDIPVNDQHGTYWCAITASLFPWNLLTSSFPMQVALARRSK